MNPTKHRDIPLYIYHAGQCDPKKCTGRKMARFDLARLYDRVSRLPRSAILLDPMAEKALSPADDSGKGIIVLDCSWEEVERIFPELGKLNLEHRALPLSACRQSCEFRKALQTQFCRGLCSSSLHFRIQRTG